MDFGSLFYIFSLVLLLGSAAGIWWLLRRCSERTQRTVVFLLMLMNTLQHFFKPLIYPQYRGMGFSALETAYNVCAVLIIASPWVFLWGGRFLKNFVFFAGTVAGLAAIAVPVWYLGMEVTDLGWDYFRFYLCHGLLFASSLMPLVLGLHKLRWREFWQVGLGFLLALCLILLNDLLFISLGLYPGTDPGDLYGSLVKMNPFMMMGPPEELLWLKELAGILTPGFFLGENPWGLCVPILWYAIPVYLVESLVCFVVFALADRAGFREDWKNIKKYRLF